MHKFPHLFESFNIQTDESIKNEKDLNEMIDLAISILTGADIPKETIAVKIQRNKAGVARDILEEIKEGGYDTVVLGRRGISRARQLLFGSVSNKVVHNTTDCTVWIMD